jgi:RNA polymerase sigma-70 factor, ECF subfamily
MLGSADPDLVRRARRGDRDAVRELFELLRPGLVRYCRAKLGRIGGAYTTADDVAQEVCLAVFRALPRYRDQGKPFSAFVYAIASNKVADAQRAAVREPMTPIEALPERVDGNAGPEEQVVAFDLTRKLSAMLSTLPDKQREIILLRVAVGLSSDAVGQALGMSAAAVRVTQSRALARLRAIAQDIVDEVAV